MTLSNHTHNVLVTAVLLYRGLSFLCSENSLFTMSDENTNDGGQNGAVMSDPVDVIIEKLLR